MKMQTADILYQVAYDKFGSVIAKVGVGTHVEPEQWGVGNVLKPGLENFCDYYLPTNSGGPIKEVAVNVEITGRTRIRRCGGWYVRVKVTFVGDCEPDVVTGGWVPAVWN